MSQEHIHQLLQNLRRDIEGLPEGEAKRHMQGLVGELDQRLATTATTAEHRDGVVDQIKHAVERFEADHPRVTAILNDIMVSLSNMGI